MLLSLSALGSVAILEFLLHVESRISCRCIERKRGSGRNGTIAGYQLVSTWYEVVVATVEQAEPENHKTGLVVEYRAHN